MRAERILLLGLAAALGLGCLAILLPFLSAIMWAAILVYCTWPLFIGCTRYMRPSVAALLITVFIAAVVLGPLVHLGLVAAHEARHSQRWVHDALINGLPPAPAFLARIPVAGGVLTDYWNASAQDLGGVGNDLQPVLGSIAHSGLKLVLVLTHGLLSVVLALLVAYFLYLSGPEIVARIRAILVRITSVELADHLLELAAATVRGVVIGILGTAAAQGVLYVIGFELAGAPQPLLLAGVAGLISIIPAGAAVVYVPLCLFMLAKGHALNAILLAVYCFVVVGGADSVVRPWLISRGASLPYVLTLIGVLGGAIAFGALGIFLGPVLLALGVAVLEQFVGVKRGAWRQPKLG